MVGVILMWHWYIANHIMRQTHFSYISTLRSILPGNTFFKCLNPVLEGENVYISWHALQTLKSDTTKRTSRLISTPREILNRTQSHLYSSLLNKVVTKLKHFFPSPGKTGAKWYMGQNETARFFKRWCHIWRFLLKLNARFEIRHIIRKARPTRSKVKLFI